MLLWRFLGRAPGIPVHSFHGTSKRERERTLNRVQRRGGVLLTTYGMVLTSWEQLSSYNGRDFVWVSESLCVCVCLHVCVCVVWVSVCVCIVWVSVCIVWASVCVHVCIVWVSVCVHCLGESGGGGGGGSWVLLSAWWVGQGL